MNIQLCNEPDSEGPIHFYEQKHYWLSNFSAFQVVFDGDCYATSEHAYQAQRVTNEIHMTEVQRQSSPHAAMKLARQLPQRVDWDEVKVGIMLEICRAKLRQHPYIQAALEKTGDRELVEVSPIDAFWGWGPNRDGRNELGKIWMKLREEGI